MISKLATAIEEKEAYDKKSTIDKLKYPLSRYYHNHYGSLSPSRKVTMIIFQEKLWTSNQNRM